MSRKNLIAKKSWPRSKQVIQSDSDLASRESKISNARTYLDSTRKQFLESVSRAKDISAEDGIGVLAGPVKRFHRAK